MEEEKATGESEVSIERPDSKVEAEQEEQLPSGSPAEPEESKDEEPSKENLEESHAEPTEQVDEPAPEAEQEPQPEPRVEEGGDSNVAAAATASEEPSPKKSSKKKKNTIQLKVVLLEGDDLDLEENSKALSEAVINPAHTETQTLETDFFSTYFYDSHQQKDHSGQFHKLKQKIFLIPGRQLKAQFSRREKDSLTEPWKFYYGVKFYVPDPNNSKLLKDDHSRFLYCLQLCDDIRANRVHVDRETAIRLTALMLQGKLGDYDAESCQNDYYNQYPQFQLLPDARKPDNYEAQLIEVHKAKAGYTPAQTDAEFLSIAKDLPRYGEHLFLARTMRDSTNEDCEVVTIGNGCKGITIYHGESKRIHVPWKDILKISYKRDKFRIMYHPPEQESDADEEANGKRKKIKQKFYTGPRPQAKRIWKNAVEQHVFFHLDSTKTPTIISNFFVRSSMRYSFKKTLPSAKKDPEPVKEHKDRPRKVVPRDLPKDDEDWFILQYPPLYDPDASKQQEHQKVQVDFKSKQEEEDADRFIIHREQIGSLELIDSFKPEEDVKKERTYNLSVVDEDSKAATVSVSLNIDPPSGVTLTSGGQEVKGVAVFDSNRMPVVNVGSASAVTTGTVIEQDGKQLSTGEHSQKYPLEEVGVEPEGEEKPAGLPRGDSEEAQQVKQFLDKEHEKFQNVDTTISPPPEVEIEVSS